MQSYEFILCQQNIYKNILTKIKKQIKKHKQKSNIQNNYIYCTKNCIKTLFMMQFNKFIVKYYAFLPQQFLYFLPEPQGQGSLRPTVFSA